MPGGHPRTMKMVSPSPSMGEGGDEGETIGFPPHLSPRKRWRSGQSSPPVGGEEAFGAIFVPNYPISKTRVTDGISKSKLICHCEEQRDEAIRLFQLVIDGEIASPDQVRGRNDTP